ncbi:MAG TPA: hypothetical protein VN840_07650 [Streptosporangiaceae bacterium]|nr:hypothetical protein [Streptosporangiaceae bacterium]
MRQYVDGTAWCARRRDDRRYVLNAAGPDDLAAMIARAEEPEAG